MHQLRFNHTNSISYFLSLACLLVSSLFLPWNVLHSSIKFQYLTHFGVFYRFVAKWKSTNYTHFSSVKSSSVAATALLPQHIFRLDCQGNHIFKAWWHFFFLLFFRLGKNMRQSLKLRNSFVIRGGSSTDDNYIMQIIYGNLIHSEWIFSLYANRDDERLYRNNILNSILAKSKTS